MLKFGSAVLAVLIALPAVAEEAASAVDDSTFALMPATGQHLRIDRRTGAVSLCAEQNGTWSCQLLADDRARYDDRIAALEKEVEALKGEIAALKDEKAALEARLAPPAEPPRTEAERESDRFDRFLGYTDRMFRHFFDLVEEFRDETGGPI